MALCVLVFIMLVAYCQLCHQCCNLAEGGCLLSRLHFMRCCYFLGHVACRNLPWQGLLAVFAILCLFTAIIIKTDTRSFYINTHWFNTIKQFTTKPISLGTTKRIKNNKIHVITFTVFSAAKKDIMKNAS